MGVPAFFRWLSRKYPSIVVTCVEEKPRKVNDVTVPVDTTKPNPNDVEFDNLYLDMNGIIHPCTHPEDKPAPKNEDEMMVAIFEYIDRLIRIVRPRRLLYMAIDGVAPRAKMNQQRSRRFRASKESVELAEEKEKMREQIFSKGGYLPPAEIKERFDHNCITPGTEFMSNLAKCLRYYIADRLTNDPGWEKISVILSDASAPGEGEHKIMDFIRRQRAQPDHDPNTHHCLCGADADLIMLGLATHEPHFTIIREEFKPNKPRPCPLCNQLGHLVKDCEGLPREKKGEHDQFADDLPPAEQEFIFLRLCILREYLERELTMASLPFEFDLERSIDDWVFMCFFVGNDFLPHLPSLEIREGAIDRLITIYKSVVHRTSGYMTDNGFVNLNRVQLIMESLGQMEDAIFKKRRTDELDFRRRQKDRNKRQRTGDRPAFTPGGQFSPHALGRGRDSLYGNPPAVHNPRQAAYEMRKQSMESQNQSYGSANTSGGSLGSPSPGKRPSENDDEPEPEDNVRLWEDGWKERYYRNKFDVSSGDSEFKYGVVQAYVHGLCWVLRYYYQGCPSWKWFYPYHYAPFASDFLNVETMPSDFEKGTHPFNPLEQLMGVFPAASGNFLPPTWRKLMSDPESPIIDFYPVDFGIDLNGKKFAWQGVALLPFVDEERLRAALEKVYPDLEPYEVLRNSIGSDMLFVGEPHPLCDFLLGLYECGSSDDEAVDVTPKLCDGIAGTVKLDEAPMVPNKVIKTPIPGLEDILKNKCVGILYKDPQYPEDYVFKAAVLSGAKIPQRVLKAGNWEEQNSGKVWKPVIGFNPNRQQAHLNPSSMRMLQHAVSSRPSFHQVPMPSSVPIPPQRQQWYARAQPQRFAPPMQPRIPQHFQWDSARPSYASSFNQRGQQMQPRSTWRNPQYLPSQYPLPPSARHRRF